MYKSIFSNQSKKFIKNLNKQRQDQIKEVIDKLIKDPFSLPYKKLRPFLILSNEKFSDKLYKYSSLSYM